MVTRRSRKCAMADGRIALFIRREMTCREEAVSKGQINSNDIIEKGSFRRLW